MRSEDQPSRVLYDLCSLLLSVLRFPHLAGPEIPPRPPLSPAGLASLLLGVSLVMMLCGSVTFAIGFILMPWVLGMVMVLCFVGIVSNLSGLGRAILCLGFPAASRGSSNEVPGTLMPLHFWYRWESCMTGLVCIIILGFCFSNAFVLKFVNCTVIYIRQAIYLFSEASAK